MSDQEPSGQEPTDRQLNNGQPNNGQRNSDPPSSELLLREEHETLVSLSTEGVWRFELNGSVSATAPEDEIISAMATQGYLADCNDAMARMYGFADAKSIVGRKFSEFHDVNSPETIEFLRAFIRSGYRLINVDTVERDIDGNDVYFQNSFYGIIEGGILRRVWGTQRDLTAKRKIEIELQQERQRLELSLKAAEIGTWEIDPETRVRHWDARARELMGIAPDHPLGRGDDFVNAVREDHREKIRELTARVMRGEGDGVYKVEVPVIGIQDRVERWLMITGKMMLDAVTDKRVFLGTVIDITDRKRSEEEARVARVAAEEASRAKSDFLANMSHEVRTPLTAILGFTELAAEKVDPDSDLSEFLRGIQRNGRHLLQLIEEMLDIEKVEAGRLKLHSEKTDVSMFLDGFLQETILAAKEKGIGFRLEVAPSIPSEVSVDATRMKQVIVNLVGNALKFTEHGEVSVRVGFQNQPTPRLTFEVSDTGPGIPEAKIDLLFKPFSQIDSSTKRRYGGTGLGLALARKIARVMAGDVVLKQSRVGQGSVFYTEIGVEAPVFDGVKSEITGHSRITPTRDLEGVRVLAVEDSIDNQILISRFLKPFGAIVELADNGAEGITKALNNIYDVVLMDIQMPEVDGYEALARLRDHGYDRPVLALTAHAMAGEKDRVAQAGFDDFLTKPINRAVLVEAIHRHIAPALPQ